MRAPARAARETQRVLAELVAEHGRAEVIHRRWECPPDVRDRLVENFETAGVLGGAGAIVRREDGAVLLVRYGDGDGWSDPGVTRQVGESFATCARRGVQQNTGLSVDVGALLQVHVLYADDWTDREPVAHPFVLFEAAHRSGTPQPGEAVRATQWFRRPPVHLRYDQLAELF